MNRNTVLFAISALTLFAASAEAKWRLVGPPGNDTGLEYLQIDRIPADEAGDRIKFFKELLGPEETLELKGKVSAGKGGARSVKISMDGAAGKELKPNEDGVFEYQFKPSTTTIRILLLQAAYSAGKETKTEELRREIALSAEPVQAAVMDTLNALFNAYANGDQDAFMALVDAGFPRGKAALARALKKDFSSDGDRNTLYAVNSAASGPDGRLFVSITYNRAASGRTKDSAARDIGVTEFTFMPKDGKLLLHGMKQPLVFGLSDPDGVASGSVPAIISRGPRPGK